MISKRIGIELPALECLETRTMTWAEFFKLLESAELVEVSSTLGAVGQVLLARAKILGEPQKRWQRSRKMRMRKKRRKRRKDRMMMKKKRKRTKRICERLKKRNRTKRICERMSKRTGQVIL